MAARESTLGTLILDLVALCEGALSDQLCVSLSRHTGLTGQALVEPVCPLQRETKARGGGWGSQDAVSTAEVHS